MTLAVDDNPHRRWRERIDGLVDEWRTVVELPDAAIDLTDEADTPAVSKPAR